MNEPYVAPVDPPRRPDSTCACGCGRPPIAKAKGRKDVEAALQRDPFASVTCVRRYFGLPAVYEVDEEARTPGRRPTPRPAVLP